VDMRDRGPAGPAGERMTDRPEVTDDLYRTAKALAREVAETFGDRREDPDDNWARQHIGDWADTLFLAGWQV